MSGTVAILRPGAGIAVNVFLVLLVVLLPWMFWAVGLARKRRLRQHRRAMKVAFLLFVAALLAFEASMRFDPRKPPLPWTALGIHLCFAVPCFLLWGYQVAVGSRAFRDPAPHRRRGWILVSLLVPTVATGIWVYVAMFPA